MPRSSDFSRAALRFWQVPQAERIDFLRAVAELARARRRLHRTAASQVIASNTPGAQAPTPAQAATAARIALAITRAARFVPWRSDCLVQALAGQSWLQRHMIPAEIVIGTARHPDGNFGAHAWLSHDGEVLLGGDITAFQPFPKPDPKMPGNLPD